MAAILQLLPFAAQPAQKGAHELLGVEPVGLGPPTLGDTGVVYTLHSEVHESGHSYQDAKTRDRLLDPRAISCMATVSLTLTTKRLVVEIRLSFEPS
jgi:hypothetical protein